MEQVPCLSLGTLRLHSPPGARLMIVLSRWRHNNCASPIRSDEPTSGVVSPCPS